MTQQIAAQTAVDRTGLIIALSILAIVILGPLTGVPAWIMANQDLRDLSRGFIHSSSEHSLSIGRRLAIIGTFFSPIWLFMIGMMLFVFAIMFGEMMLSFG